MVDGAHCEVPVAGGEGKIGGKVLCRILALPPEYLFSPLSFLGFNLNFMR
jgi:hypothetical protein